MANEDYHEPDWNGDDWVVDNRLKHFLQKYLHAHQSKYQRLKNLRMCGSKVAHVKGGEPAVFLLANGTQSRFFANTTCHSPWACPACAAVRMANACENIGAAIDALRTQHDQMAFMVTFTLPHIISMSCADIFQLLLNSWRTLSRTGKVGKRTSNTHVIISDKADRGIKNRHGEVITHKKGEVVRYLKDVGTFANMRETCQINHTVKVYEFTYGDANGWHPHIHALFWVPRKLWNKIADFERPLLDQWWSIAKKQYIKLYDKREPDLHANHVADAEELFADWRKFPVTGHRSVFFSKADDGSIRKVTSAFYITDTDDQDAITRSLDDNAKTGAEESGYAASSAPALKSKNWTADMELTQSHRGKIAKPGHYTPQQLIKLAFDFRYSHPAKSERLMGLYCEYAMATFKHRRVELSKTGLNKIISAWKKTQTYINRLKKKLTQHHQIQPWHVVAWFNEQQWLRISFLEMSTHESLKAYLLYAANLPDARQLIAETLEQYDIKLIERKHDLEECVLKASNRTSTDENNTAVA